MHVINSHGSVNRSRFRFDLTSASATVFINLSLISHARCFPERGRFAVRRADVVRKMKRDSCLSGYDASVERERRESRLRRIRASNRFAERKGKKRVRLRARGR